MKYFSLDSVISAFESNKNKTSDGFWGIMAILLSLDNKIIPCKQYDLDCQKIANILERWFSVRGSLKSYNTSAIWYAVFSTVWIKQLALFIKANQTPNIYDVICWMYQDHAFKDSPTHGELLSLFCNDTSIDVESLKTLFDLSKRDFIFSDSKISHKSKIEKLQDLYGTAGNNNAIKCNGSYIVAEAGSFQRAPFTQTLYASTENFKCLMITSSAPDIYYPMNFNDKPQDSDMLDYLQVIYYGAPGTGKSHMIDNYPKVTEENTIRTTFHPDSDYSTFVGAYKPTMENVPMSKTFTSSKDGTYAEYVQKTESHPGTEKKIVYKYVPQAFLKAYVAAWSDLENPHFLVIEEINRGNCAQIFGDLFQLLDRNNAGSSSYAIHADEDITQFLAEDKNGFANLSEEQKEAIRSFVLVKDSGKTEAIGNAILSGKKLLLPPNLYIWATMNTSDQSLFPIDSAFKRRWNWKYMPIEYNPIDKKTQEPLNWKFQVGDTLYSWGEFLGKINPEIFSLTESSDKQMGYFFAKADPNTGVISEDVFLNKVLFYLWTDVFKDYDLSSKYLLNKNANRPFRFTDFFEDKEGLTNFISNLELTPVDDSIIGESFNDEQGDAPTLASTKRKKHFLSLIDKNGNEKREPLYTGYFNYVKDLVERFGEDKVADTINGYGITRHQGEVKLMDTKPYPNLNVAYRQKQIGKYYLLVGMNQTTDIAKRLNDNFNLGYTIDEIVE